MKQKELAIKAGIFYITNMISKATKINTKDRISIPAEEIIFDADRDNGGKGVSPDEIIKILRAVSPDNTKARGFRAQARPLYTAGQIIL